MAFKPSSSLSSITPWVGLPLSIFMIFVCGLTFTGLPFGDGPNQLVMTTFRDPRSGLNIVNHRALQAPPWLYQGAKGVGAALWSILIPLQHSATIRKRWPQVHRVSGYTTVLLSIELALSGYYMQIKGMVTTHQDLFHIHTSGLVFPFAWPTFTVAIYILGVFYFYSLYKLVTTIRRRNIASHSRWATFHSMTGYAISIERALSLGVFGFARILHRLPDEIKLDWLRLPRDPEAMYALELDAISWTLTAAGFVVLGWTYRLFWVTRQKPMQNGNGKLMQNGNGKPVLNGNGKPVLNGNGKPVQNGNGTAVKPVTNGNGMSAKTKKLQ